MPVNPLKCRFCGERLEKIGGYMLRCTDCTATYYIVGDEVREVFIAPIKYSKSLGLDTLLMWIKKYLGVPSEMYFDAKITWSRLLLIPYHCMVSRIKGEYTCQTRRAIYSGRVLTIPLFSGGEMYRHITFIFDEKTSSFDRQINISIPLGDYRESKDMEMMKFINKTGGALREPSIPLENKTIYRWIDVSGYNPLEVKINKDYSTIPDEAHIIGRRYIEKILTRICRKIYYLELGMEIHDEYPIYLPIWIFKYKLKERRGEYIGIVEGATGRVLYATYPVQQAAKLGFMGLGVLHLIAGGLIILGGNIVALPISLPLILYSGVYLYRGIKMGRAREI